MSEHKHTPGEWRLSEELNENLFGHAISVDILDSRDFPIACVHARPIIHDWPSKFPEMDHWADGVADGLTSINRPASEVIQNARLIAAAPELFELVLRRVKNEEQQFFEVWLERAIPAGDAESVQRQWKESSCYQDFLVEWGDEVAAIAKATGATHE